MTATPPEELVPDQLFELNAVITSKMYHLCNGMVAKSLYDWSWPWGPKGPSGSRSWRRRWPSKRRRWRKRTVCGECAIVVNRVAVARETFDLLRKTYGERVSLMIGRVRPFDRDRLTEELQRAFAAGRTEDSSSADAVALKFVVATQLSGSRCRLGFRWYGESMRWLRCLTSTLWQAQPPWRIL